MKIDKKIFSRLLMGTFISLASVSCKKFVEIPSPETKTVFASVFSNSASATSAVLNVYANMPLDSYRIADIGGLLSDEFTFYGSSGSYAEFYRNAMNAVDINSSVGLWKAAYNYIYQANAVISGLHDNTHINTTVNHQLTGEAYFIRAFWHFQLTNLYGDVPLALTTDYTITSTLARTAQKSVYQQIINDLKTAISLLNSNYVDITDTVTTSERIRPNKATAQTLLAKVYLYSGDYPDAATTATQVISNSMYALDTDPNSVFLKNSSEAIWQLQPTTPLRYAGATYEGQSFILTSKPGSGAANNAAISPQLLSAFEAGDTRLTKWINSIKVGGATYNFPFKYKYNNKNAGGTVREYSMVFRLAELYLIRAEANAQSGGNLQQAIADLNVIRTRAGLQNTTATTQPDVLNAIYHERQVELFSEWGNRWFDLKRTGTIDAVMGAVTSSKGGTWQSFDALFPIPFSEITADRNLTQNAGY